MGVVFEAEDARLGRHVALKMIRPAGGDPSAKERMWREARAAASVNHPNVCQVFDIGEDGGDVYLAMELLEGEPLSTRLQRGPLPPREALQVALEILAALDALHARGILHRDLKPSNVFLTKAGVKLMDFGLALAGGDATHSDVRLTQTGTVVGTPGYMAPERWAQETLGPESDLFAVGALLFEMLTGKPAFTGRNAMEIYHAVVHEQPPALSGGGTADAVDRVLQTALAKDPRERYPTAAAMAEAVRAAQAGSHDATAPQVRTITRLAVLPFRLLRPDPDVDFLGLGLPDAITTSLSGLGSIVVRSTHAAAKHAGPPPDLAKLASDVGVDVVLVGTLLRGGDRVRVTAQLLEAPGGTVLWSETADVQTNDLFLLQDELARRIVESLALPLSSRDRSAMQRRAPATPRASELFLRANQLSVVSAMLPQARDLYLQALEEDPGYAPAWARLGRTYRVMAKFGFDDGPSNLVRAEEAFRKALSIDPDLPIAHNLWTHYQLEELGEAREAVTRLLARAQARPADPELFNGLVLALRFVGLLEPSIAADKRARRLDPGVRTSVSYTYWQAGDYARALEYEDQDMQWVRLYTLPMLGRESEAAAVGRDMAKRVPLGLMRPMAEGTLGAIERNPEPVKAGAAAMVGSVFHDPEGHYFSSRNLARVGLHDEALAWLDRVVSRGYTIPGGLRRDTWLDPLRSRPEFAAILRKAEDGRAKGVDAYRVAGGERLLGPVGAG
jgi:TolB-like protein